MTEEQFDPPVREAVPVSEIAPTVGDLPPDYGEPGVADFPDPAWDDITDEDVSEVPGEGEPEDDDTPEEQEEVEQEDEQDEMEDNPVVPPGIAEGGDVQPDEEFDHDPEEAE
jgi:hypothetical protein